MLLPRETWRRVNSAMAIGLNVRVGDYNSSCNGVKWIFAVLVHEIRQRVHAKTRRRKGKEHWGNQASRMLPPHSNHVLHCVLAAFARGLCAFLSHNSKFSLTTQGVLPHNIQWPFILPRLFIWCDRVAAGLREVRCRRIIVLVVGWSDPSARISKVVIS